MNNECIRIYDEVINSETCQYFISIINKSEKKAGKIFNNEGEQYVNSEIKMAEDVCFSINFPKETDYLISLFNHYVMNLYEKELNVSIPINFAEYVYGRVYRKNQGFYKAHVDASSPGNSSRCISLLLYLNNIKEGGELFFPYQNKTISPEEGRLVIFPSNWMFLHEAKTPISNDRYILRTFMTSF